MDLTWLDKIIEEQKHNIDIMKDVCNPFSPAELQEHAEYNDFDE